MMAKLHTQGYLEPSSSSGAIFANGEQASSLEASAESGQPLSQSHTFASFRAHSWDGAAYPEVLPDAETTSEAASPTGGAQLLSLLNRLTQDDGESQRAAAEEVV